MPRVLIAGCGFVGLATARLFHQAGWAVAGCTHSDESAARLRNEPFRVEACDFADRDALNARGDWHGFEAVIHCASSGKGGTAAYRRVYLEGARNLVEVLEPRLLVFTSSTSVYAQVSGEWVSEESVAAPERETGRILRETEDLVIAAGGTVTRLAGIYGPGRSVLLRKFFANEALIEGDGLRWINQVHRDDIAASLVMLAGNGLRGLFNVSDDQPLEQRALYEWLAKRFVRPLPPSGPIDPNRKRGWTNKRVSNTRLRSVGWTPRYRSFFDAVANDPGLLGNG